MAQSDHGAWNDALKLKQSPDDFRVEELTSVAPAAEGVFAFYQLVKSNWTTPDAVEKIRARWKIQARRISFGGLKDRHARTIQYLTIARGPKRNLTQEGITLRHLGQVAREYQADDIRANRFTITLRDLSAAQVETASQALNEVAALGAPNYFDDQRFGSVAGDRSFIAKEMVLGNFEQALRLAVAAPYEHDRAEAKKEKAILRERWGDWKACRASLKKGQLRGLLEYLEHQPTDFRGALARLRPELQGLYLAAWQSHLWNRILGRWLLSHLSHDRIKTIHSPLGDLPVPLAMSSETQRQWESLQIPLPSARLRMDPSAPWAAAVAAVMAEEGIPLEEMKIKGMHKPFFSKGERPAMIRPEQLEYEAGSDEKHTGRAKMTLTFELPRGAYATMIVKRVMMG